jgi:hypothetical protein
VLLTGAAAAATAAGLLGGGGRGTGAWLASKDARDLVPLGAAAEGCLLAGGMACSTSTTTCCQHMHLRLTLKNAKD